MRLKALLKCQSLVLEEESMVGEVGPAWMEDHGLHLVHLEHPDRDRGIPTPSWVWVR